VDASGVVAEIAIRSKDHSASPGHGATYGEGVTPLADVELTVKVWRQGEDICLVKGDDFITTVRRGSSSWRYLDRLLGDSGSAPTDTATGWNEGYGERVQDRARAIPHPR
jgi:hypothetical protein